MDLGFESSSFAPSHDAFIDNVEKESSQSYENIHSYPPLAYNFLNFQNSAVNGSWDASNSLRFSFSGVPSNNNEHEALQKETSTNFPLSHFDSYKQKPQFTHLLRHNKIRHKKKNRMKNKKMPIPNVKDSKESLLADPSSTFQGVRKSIASRAIGQDVETDQGNGPRELNPNGRQLIGKPSNSKLWPKLVVSEKIDLLDYHREKDLLVQSTNLIDEQDGQDLRGHHSQFSLRNTVNEKQRPTSNLLLDLSNANNTKHQISDIDITDNPVSPKYNEIPQSNETIVDMKVKQINDYESNLSKNKQKGFSNKHLLIFSKKTSFSSVKSFKISVDNNKTLQKFTNQDQPSSVSSTNPSGESTRGIARLPSSSSSVPATDSDQVPHYYSKPWDVAAAVDLKRLDLPNTEGSDVSLSVTGRALSAAFGNI